MLGKDIRALIAPILRECPPACGIVSMTDIDVSSDLSYITILISALEHPELAVAFLKERRPELQKRLTSLGLRKLPILRFRIDREQDKSNKVEKLLESLE